MDKFNNSKQTPLGGSTKRTKKMQSKVQGTIRHEAVAQPAISQKKAAKFHEAALKVPAEPRQVTDKKNSTGNGQKTQTDIFANYLNH